MNPVLNIPLKMQKLLLKNTVMSVKQLRHEFRGRSRSSLFRDLQKLDEISSFTHTGQYHALEISSFTHTGQYHALKRSAAFDESGLWFFQDIGFSQYGTLKNTLVQMISDAQAGVTHKEMKTRFRIDVQKPLTDLVNTSAVTRQLLPNRLYVYLSATENKAEDQFYLSATENKAEDQFQRRLAINDRPPDIALPPDSIRIEILVEVIHAPQRTLEASVLGPLLRKRGVIIKDDEIAYVLAYYDIKKNGL
jgi:hypothetical protein